MRLQRFQLRQVHGRHALDVLVGSLLPVHTGCLQSIERLVGAQMLRQCPEIEHLPSRTVHAK